MVQNTFQIKRATSIAERVLLTSRHWVGCDVSQPVDFGWLEWTGYLRLEVGRRCKTAN